MASSVTEGPAQGRGLAGVELELAGMAAGRVASGNAIGCSSTRPWLRCSPVDAKLSRGPAAMRRDLLGGIVVLAESGNNGVPQLYCNYATLPLNCIS